MSSQDPEMVAKMLENLTLPDPAAFRPGSLNTSQPLSPPTKTGEKRTAGDISATRSFFSWLRHRKAAKGGEAVGTPRVPERDIGREPEPPSVDFPMADPQ